MAQRTGAGDKPPRFTIISAVYNVSRYLDEYIAAIEAQQFPLGQVEVIMVDDGSTDDSRSRLEAWRARRPELVTVLHKENGGQSSARNLGMEHAHGEWVSFPDPDDVLEPDYLSEIHNFIDAMPTVQMVAAKRILFNEETGVRKAHPLNMHFTTHNRLRNLDVDTAHFHGSAPCAFFRLDELRRQQLRFDDRIKPSFEDGHFCCRYLLHVDEPWVGYVQSAIYLYRKRADASSTLDLSWIDPRRYTDMVEHGYLSLLREAAELRDRPPVWLQSMVLYELSWYFKVEDAVPWVSTAAHGEVGARFNELLGELVAYFDRRVIEAYPNRRLKAAYRDILVHGYTDEEDWHTPYTIVDKIDMRQRTMRLTYRFTGKPPQLLFDVNGAEVMPLHTKIRTLRYFDRDVMYEHIIWLPFGTVRVLFDGVETDTRLAEPEQPSPRLDSWAIRKELDPVIKEQTAPKPPELSLGDKAVLRAADSRLVRRYFRHAWVLMDRVHNADDSAEHLFRYLRRHKRQTNAWFVIESGTPDDARLRRDGYRRVIKHGSLLWKLLMLNAEHLISSHIDLQIIGPPEILRLRDPRWRFAFLQHGVIKDDISRWLNIKDLDVFITSTRAEYDSIVSDGSPYKFTGREVALTGLPRFDRLYEQGQKFSPDRRDYLLVAPTWRNWLMGASTGEHRRHADVQRLKESDFIRSWWGVLSSDKLRALAEANGLKIALLMHPNMQSVVADLDVPPHVEVLTFEGQDVQATFARAKVFTTDYSSMAFNAAYIERPQVYFQFDYEQFFGGGHAGRKGYFDFERDGFGPVAYTVDDAVDAIAAALAHGPQPEQKYLDRINAAFPERDGRCSERTATAIRDSVRRVKPSESVVHAEEAPIAAVGTAPAGLEDVASGRTAELAGVDPEDESAEAVDTPDVPEGLTEA